MASTKSKSTKEPLPDETSAVPAFDLTQYGITVTNIRRNLSPAALYTEVTADVFVYALGLQ